MSGGSTAQHSIRASMVARGNQAGANVLRHHDGWQHSMCNLAGASTAQHSMRTPLTLLARACTYVTLTVTPTSTSQAVLAATLAALPAIGSRCLRR